MLLNCGVGEESWESLGQQGDQTSRNYSPKELMPKLQYFGHLMWKADSLEKTDAGKARRLEEKGTTEDQMIEWHEFE